MLISFFQTMCLDAAGYVADQILLHLLFPTIIYFDYEQMCCFLNQIQMLMMFCFLYVWKHNHVLTLAYKSNVKTKIFFFIKMVI